ncbi:MAG: translation initiation factor Sui1 [Magnetococcales bacterium]|nr:translation initiation factor Sui1 [Magnetococcales bacterium]
MKERLVYSTESGRSCPECQQPVSVCICRQTAAVKSDGIVRVGRESKGRQGKEVTVIRGIPLQPSALAQLAKTLRTACGSGGTVKDGVIEVQGDHVLRIITMLSQHGWQIKRSGG